MKRIYTLVTLVCLFVYLLPTQAQENRSVQTIVADVLAQMPADKQTDYTKQIADLLSTGEEGVITLVKMIQAPGQGDNAKVDYALSGLSHYVMGTGDENIRRATANAYVKALNIVNETEARIFIIKQLQILGKDESVDALAPYLNEESLSDPAARALASIRTEKAGLALKSALLRRMGTPKTQRDVILAIGEARIADTEDILKRMIAGGDENLQKALFYALGRVGSKASLKELSAAAEKNNYALDKTGANEAYLMLLKNLVEQGDVQEAKKEATNLLNKATKAGKTHTRNAALQILLSIEKENGLKRVQTALKDPSPEFRNAALTYLSCYANQEIYIELVKTMMKAGPEVKVDILSWLGRESQNSEKNVLIKNLNIRFDLPVKQVLIDQLKNKNLAVKQAAVWTLVKIGDTSTVPALAQLLTLSEEDIALGQKALISFKGDVVPEVVRVISKAPDAGKIAAVEILALRKASANINTVLDLIKSGSSSDVRKAAYIALKDVVAEKDLTLLCGMLESSDAEAEVIPPLQQAVIASVSSLPVNEQLAVISRRMLQSGEAKKYLYYVVLAATGNKDVPTILVNSFKQSEGAAKDAAFKALLAWKGVGVEDELLSICKDASASTYFDPALTAYIRAVSSTAFTGENRYLNLRKAMEIAKTNEQKNTILRQLGRTGTIQALLYVGEFLDDKALQQLAANAIMNIALNNTAYTGTKVKELLNKVSAVLDNPDAGYQRENIKKHLSEMPEEEGFVSIFNGKDLSGWKGLVQNPIIRSKMKPEQLAKEQAKADEQMRRDWKVVDGMLVFDGAGYNNLCTEKQYGDIEMYIDWMLDPAGPEADAGIYLRGTPQVQMWDTARVKVGAQVGSGGLYNNRIHPSKPLKVADNKLGEWNTMYIKITGDRVTVYLNGELVTNNVILENYWDRKQAIFPVEQLELQAHGSKVYYRDIYVKELKRPEPFKLSEAEEKEGYKILFDGTNMYEWTGNTADYTMQDGTITLVPGEGSGGNLYSKDEYENFVLRFDFQLTPAANNGLGIRTPKEGDAAYVGMELQILDNEHPVYRDLKEYQYHGSVYGIIPAKRGYLKPTGEWNVQEVIADGDRIKITLNDNVILDSNIREATKNGTPDHREHPGLLNKKGYIGFLGHGSPIKFRNIRIKELK
jgi:HEAT repeat protein